MVAAVVHEFLLASSLSLHQGSVWHLSLLVRAATIETFGFLLPSFRYVCLPLGQFCAAVTPNPLLTGLFGSLVDWICLDCVVAQ